MHVAGRTYDVEIRYRGVDGPSSMESIERNQSIDDRLLGAVDELLSKREAIFYASSPASARFVSPIDCSPVISHGPKLGATNRCSSSLFAITESEQQRVFAPHKERRIILATNVAESSLTVPGIHSVIDTGTARISRYAPRSKVQRLPIEPISQASANQRAGRCGRLGPGICIRLYDESDFASRPPFTTPEIRRTDLSSAILQTELLRIGPLEGLPLLDPPRPEMIRDGHATLFEIGATDESGRITDIGRKLGRWPVSPRVGRMLIDADRQGCLADVLIIASALEAQDVRLRPAEKQGDADAAHERFIDPQSDFLTYLRLWDFYHHLKENSAAVDSSALAAKIIFRFRASVNGLICTGNFCDLRKMSDCELVSEPCLPIS